MKKRRLSFSFPIVTILSDPEDYHEFLKELEAGDITEKSRQLYALKAFNHTAEYDEAISDFFRKKFAGDGAQQLSLRYVCSNDYYQAWNVSILTCP